MSGSCTRQQYDPLAYDERLARNNKLANYRLDANYAIHRQKCFAPYSSAIGAPSDPISNQIDVDSILKGIHKNNTKSNHIQHCASTLLQSSPTIPTIQGVLPDCHPQLETEYTRFTYPAYDIKGLNVPDMRMDYPLHDPQCHIFEDFQINTRLQAKDNHRAVWQEPLAMRTERKNNNLDYGTNYAPFTR